jgi:hypothetical protein
MAVETMEEALILSWMLLMEYFLTSAATETGPF